MKVRICLIVSILFQLSTSAQQDSLTLDQVIAEALAKNYGVRISRIEKDIAASSNTPGMAGQMPTVNAGVADQYSTSNIFQRFATGQEITSANASGNNISAFVALDWTIFNGFRISIEKDRLAELQAMSEISLKNAMSQLVREVTVAYVGYVRAAKQLEQGKRIAKLSEERASIAKASFEAGISAKTFWLQSQVDLNSQQQALRLIEIQLLQFVQQLNLLMGKSENSVWTLSHRIPLSAMWDVEQMKKDMLNSNLELTLSKKAIDISEMNVRFIQGEKLPSVTLSGAYNFSRTDNSAGFSLLNRNYGPVAGVSVGIPIFTGGSIGTRKEVAVLQSEIAKLQYEEVKLNLLTRFDFLQRAHAEYLNMSSLQRTTVELAKENYDISQDRFRLGQAGILEVREAELSYQQAITRLYDLEYETSITETELMLLTGKMDY
jgi:outer membrane protein